MDVTLYTTHCPQCKVLTMKLQRAGINFTENENIDEIMSLGYKSAPLLKVNDQFYLFKDACKWADSQRSK